MEPTVIIRPVTLDDAHAFALHGDNPKIAANMRDIFPSPYKLDDAKRFISSVITLDPPRVMAIVADGDVCGAISLVGKEDVYARSFETGYWIGEDFWGRGIATQAVKQIVEYGFTNFNVERIYACVFSPNLSSKKVLLKNGFVHEGTLRKSVFKNGVFHDELIFSVLRG